MMLDLATLLAASATATLSLAIPVLFVAWRVRVHQGLALWGLGLVLITLSYPAFGLRALGWTSGSIVATNLLTGLTLVSHTLAVRAFQRERIWRLPTWVVWLPLTLNMAAVLVFLRDDHWRNILVAATQMVMGFMLLHEAWAPGMTERRLTGRWVLIGGASILCMTMVSRTVFMALASDWDARYNVPTHVQASTYFVAMAVVLINSMGFVLMQMERSIDLQRALATHDALTGLYNRSALQDLQALCAAQARRHHAPLACLMLDIDHFKYVNDAHGHLAGDKVLQEVARRVRARMRQSDILARFGGEEFLAILPATDQAGAMHLAEDVRQAIDSQPMVLPETGEHIHVTISIGVHVGIPDEDPKAMEKMFGLSDQALYQAKEAGRNRVVCG